MNHIWRNPLSAFNRAITLRDCADEPGTFVPEAACVEEGSRIVGGFLVKKGFDLATLQADDDVDGTYATTVALLADQANHATGEKFLVTATWLVYTKTAATTGALGDYTTAAAAYTIARAISEEYMRVVPGLAGNWTAATSNKKPGMGHQSEKHSSYSYSIPLRHYSVDANLSFWDTINGSNNWSMVFIFENYDGCWGALDKNGKPVVMDIVMSPASDDELGGTRRMEGACAWKGKRLPYNLLAPVIPAFTQDKLAELFA
jgi:hypothetical protein